MNSSPKPADPADVAPVPAALADAVAEALAGTPAELAFQAAIAVESTAGQDDPVGVLLALRGTAPDMSQVLAARAVAQTHIQRWVTDAAALAAQVAGVGAGDEGMAVFVRPGCGDHNGPMEQVVVLRDGVTVTVRANSIEGIAADEAFEMLREALVAGVGRHSGADVVVVWPAGGAVALYRRRCEDLLDDEWLAGEPEQLLLDLQRLDLPDPAVDFDRYDVARTAAEDPVEAAITEALAAAGLLEDLQLGRWDGLDASECAGR